MVRITALELYIVNPGCQSKKRKRIEFPVVIAIIALLLAMEVQDGRVVKWRHKTVCSRLCRVVLGLDALAI